MRRFLLITMLVLILAGSAAGAGMVYLNTRIGGAHLLTFVNEMALKGAGMRLDWERAKGSFLFDLKVDGALLRTLGGDTLVTADRMRIRFDPWAVLNGRIELSRVEADQPVVSIGGFSSRSGSGALEEAGTGTDAGDRGESAGTMPDLRIGTVVLRDASVTITNGGPVRALSGLHLRTGLRLSPGGGVELRVERLRTRLEGWGLTVLDLTGGVIFQRGRLWFAGTRGRTAGGRFEIDGALWLAGDTPGELRVRWDAADLTEWWPLIGGSWAGEGPLLMEGRLSDHPWSPRFEVTASGALGGVDIDRMLVRGSYTDGALNTELTARGPGADSVNVVLTLDTGSGAALGSLYADALRLDAGPAQLPVDVASLRAELRTASYDALMAGGSLNMAARGIRAWGLVTDSLQALVELGEGRITATEPVQVGGENFALSVAGFYDTSRDAVDLRITGSAHAPSQPLAMAGLKLEGGRIDLSLRATGRGSDPDLRGGVNLFDLRQGDMRVARSEMHVAVAQVRGARIGTFAADVDSLFIGPDFAVHRGLVDGSVRGERISLQRVEAWWGEGEAALQGEIVVEEGVATATLEEGTLAHGESLLRTIRGGLLYNLADGSGSFTLGGRTGTGHIDIRGRREAGGTLEAEGEFGLLDVGELSRTLKLPGNPEGVLTGSLSAVIGRHVETLDVRAEMADPAVAGHRYRRLDIDAGYDRGIVRISRLLLSGVEEESVRLAGDLHLPGAEAEGAEGTLRLEAEISDLRLAPLQDYLEGHQVSGELTGNLAATGTFAEPRFEGRMSLNYARFDTFQVDSVRMDLSYDGQHLLLRQGLLASMGFNARFDASLPVRVTLDPAGIEIDRGAPVSALLEGRGEPRALVQAIEGEIEQFEGDLDIGLTLAGSLDDPDLTGSAALRNGRLKPRALGQAIQDLEVDITFERDTARINTLAGRMPTEGATRRSLLSRLWRSLTGKGDPTGEFAASGTVTITDGRPLYDITLEGEGLGISDPTRSLVAIIDPSLRLTSPATAGEDLLSGTVLVRQGLMDIGMVTRMIGSESEARIERPEAEGGIRTDIEVDIPGRFRVVGTSITLDEDINVEMRGNLLVRRDPPGPVYLTGSLESVPGRGTVYAYSRRWIVDRGNITFGTIEEINPDLDVQLSTLIREAEVEVYITLSGTAREPIARFSSDSPTLTSDTDILQLILLGTTAQGQSGFNVQERMTGFIESALGRRAGEAIGLDTFQVRGIPGVTREEDTQISVGKYLGSQFYVQYSNYLKDFSSQMGELGVEYRINRNFRISLTLDRFRREYLELKWRIEY